MTRINARWKRLAIPSALLFFGWSTQYARTPVGGERSPVAANQVRASGELHQRLVLSQQYLLSKSRDIPRDIGWGADQYARWIEAIALLSDYSGDHSPQLDRILKEFLSLQKPDGSFLMTKTMRVQEWWGAARAIVSLVNYYSVSPDRRVLDAARSLAEFITENAPLQRTTDTLIHANYHSALEGMVGLWRVTGERKYLDFAERIAAITDPDVASPGNKKLAHQPITSLVKGWQPHQHHTHSYLELVQGIVDLYQATGESRWLRLAENSWDQTLEHTMWVSGGIPEVYGEFFEHNDETCPVTSWILLGLKLFRETGKADYLDVVERSVSNHLLFDQGFQGGFYADRSLCLRERVKPDNKGSVADACCSMHGARGLYEVVRYIYTTDSQGMDVNLYFDSTANLTLSTDAKPVKVRLQTHYPASGQIQLDLKSVPEGRKFDVRFRIPRFVADVRIRVNQSPVPLRQENGFAVVHGKWRSGDNIEIVFSMPLRLVTSGQNGFRQSRSPDSDVFEQAALVHGPLVLMLDRARDKLSEGSEFTVVVFQREDGSIFLPPAQSEAGAASDFEIHGAHFRSAILTESQTLDMENPGKAPWKLVTLVPMSELTGHEALWDDPYKIRNRVVILPESMIHIILGSK